MVSALLAFVGMTILQIVFCEMGFTPSKVEPDIWLHPNGSKYEYIAVYVDDLAIAAEDPSKIVDTLIRHYKFKSKVQAP